MTDYTIAEVAARVGFDTATYFSHIFHREVGCSPRAFRARIAS
jgi:AraC-like DNA-binding protein